MRRADRLERVFNEWWNRNAERLRELSGIAFDCLSLPDGKRTISLPDYERTAKTQCSARLTATGSDDICVSFL